MQNCSIYEIISICKNIQITSFISSAPFLGPSLFSFSTKFNFAKTEAIVCDVNAAPGRYCLQSPLLLTLHPWAPLLRHNDSGTAWKYPGLKTFSVIFQNISMTINIFATDTALETLELNCGRRKVAIFTPRLVCACK